MNMKRGTKNAAKGEWVSRRKRRKVSNELKEAIENDDVAAVAAVEVWWARNEKTLDTLRGDSPLAYCCRLGSMNSARWLLRAGAGVEKKGANGATPLYVSAQVNSIEMVKVLICEGQAGVNQAAVNGVTPLFISAMMGHS
jgi:hypothetical protein